MKKVVISVGGSVLVPSLESHQLKEWASTLKELAQDYHLFCVCGGGGEARRYISVCRDIGLDEATSDELGIMVTRINAFLLIAALGDSAYPTVTTSYREAKEAALHGRIIVMGGITPGQTTDAVSAVLAEEVAADLLINATAVDAIYSADPKKDANAKRFSLITPSDLIGIIMKERMGAGSNMIVDLVAAKIIERSAIPFAVMDGRKPQDIISALRTGEFHGTLVAGQSREVLPL
ncbi:uridylate kinase [Methanocalculus chunghsingensis]|uniref:Uridylate kinase n=1 Tax=Methanocalculus chunghsingensis TaxID=156457 RepID=A0A8J7W6J1_9EURY|nr:UMP kinase [Methanocalculus chunghsingensis]MBR1369241.1 uridylate kinase [Methanocalculus chunghsingensis]